MMDETYFANRKRCPTMHIVPLQAIICTSDSHFCGFAVDSSFSWHWFDDKTHSSVSHWALPTIYIIFMLMSVDVCAET